MVDWYSLFPCAIKYNVSYVVFIATNICSNKYNSLTDKQLCRFIIETSQTELFTVKLKSKEWSLRLPGSLTVWILILKNKALKQVSSSTLFQDNI